MHLRSVSLLYTAQLPQLLSALTYIVPCTVRILSNLITFNLSLLTRPCCSFCAWLKLKMISPLRWCTFPTALHSASHLCMWSLHVLLMFPSVALASTHIQNMPKLRLIGDSVLPVGVPVVYTAVCLY